MSASFASNCKLNSPEDWDEWETELLSQAQSRNIYKVLMKTEDPITIPVLPELDDYILPPFQAEAPAQGGPFQGTRSSMARGSGNGSQASASTEGGDAVHPDRVAALAEEAYNRRRREAREEYNMRSQQYRHKFSLYEGQRKSIEQTFTWMKESVSESYRKTHVSITHDWVTAYNNLKAGLNPGSREIQRAIREEYNQHMRILKPSTKDLDGWLSQWEQLMINGQRKSMTFALDKEDWSSRFLEAIRPLDNAWVTSLEHIIEKQLDDGTLTIRDMSKAFRRLITRTKRPRSTSRVLKGSFATHQQGGDNVPAEENRHRGRQANQTADRRGRSRSRPVEYSRKRDIDSMESAPKQLCAGCGGIHLVWFCFYLFPNLAPPGWVGKEWIMEKLNRWLEENSPLAQQVKRKIAGQERVPSRGRDRSRSQERTQPRRAPTPYPKEVSFDDQPANPK